MSSAVLKRKGKVRLGPGLNGVLMTAEEFDAVVDYDECYRYELVNGVLIVNPIALEAEADPNEFLGYLLRLYQFQHPRGSSLDLTLAQRYIRTGDSRRLADRVIWAGLGRLPNSKRDVPTIAFESVSAGKRNWKRDYVDKREEYLEVGGVEYWVFDRFERTFTVYRRMRPQQRIFRANEIYRTPLLPGFELSIAQLLAVADRWAESE
jgi:Uma2 family endonuclease